MNSLYIKAQIGNQMDRDVLVLICYLVNATFNPTDILYIRYANEYLNNADCCSNCAHALSRVVRVY